VRNINFKYDLRYAEQNIFFGWFFGDCGFDWSQFLVGFTLIYKFKNVQSMLFLIAALL